MTVFEKAIRSLSAFQIILLGFAGVIIFGSILLTLPIASNAGVWTPYSDALFTSTSAVCVTGLIVHDTAQYWSVFGRCVILLLIQIGGLGVVTVAVAFVMLTGRRISLMQRSVMQNAVSAPSVGGIVRFTRFILIGTFTVEAIGALLMAPVFVKDFGFWKGVGYAIFHSISAFCNAGFDLMGVRQPYSSLTTYASQPVINIVIMSLIVIGGLGFFTWQDLILHKHHFSRYRLQTKMILVTTALLLILPACYFFFAEFNEEPFGTRLLMSMFQAVTPRTAGFNTADYGAMSDSGILLSSFLMMIGGSPASTAGGIKTTTFALLLISAKATLGRKKQTACFARSVCQTTINDAMALGVIYVLLLLSGTIAIARIEELPVMKTMFECASALGTVGLTTGITCSLSNLSRAILICFMYFGRVGGLTLAYAAVSVKTHEKGHQPQERMMVG